MDKRYELPVEGGEHNLHLNYNGEIAFSLKIVNYDNPWKEIEQDPKTVKSAEVTISTWPINGGEGESATVTLYMQGEQLNI